MLQKSFQTNIVFNKQLYYVDTFLVGSAGINC